MADIAKPPPSHFIWPPPSEEQPFPIAAPLYVAPPETQKVTITPCTYRPLEKPQQLSVQNLRKVESQQTNSTEYECLNVESNITATTSTSNGSSESEYKMYQTQNNHYANMFEHTEEVDDEVEEINQKTIIDMRKTPPPIELPKPIKRVEFVEPEPNYKAETFSSVFSTRKETWQKLTSQSHKKTKEEVERKEEFQAADNNPDNSEEEQTSNEREDDDEENDVEAEIQGQLAGPYDGTFYQMPASNVRQPTPRGYQSDFQKAFITASERPFQMPLCAPTPDPTPSYIDFYEDAVREAQNLPIEVPKKVLEVPRFEVKMTTQKCNFPLREQDVPKGTLMSSMMRTASPKPMEFMRSNVIEEVHLPDDSDAYFPPPISMEPHEPYGTLESYRTKSPFVGMLTTVPDRPFTPFGREIMSQLSLDLPHNTRQVTFSNALNTAPDDLFNPSSLEYVYDPVEYTAKVYERIAVEAEADDQQTSSSTFMNVRSSPINRSYLPTIQPWSTASDHYAENSYTDATSGNESLECHVSESRRCSEFQRRRSSVMQECSGCDNRCNGCDSRRCGGVQQGTKQLSDLLKTKVSEEDEFDPDKPNPNAPYPRRSQAASPFENMQVKVTNKMTCGLHKPDEIPTYQRKWFNLPTQNPPKTPEPEELRENVPMAFFDWAPGSIASRHSSISASDRKAPSWHKIKEEPAHASIAEIGMSAKPPIPVAADSNVVQPKRSSVSEQVAKREEKMLEEEEAEDNFVGSSIFPTIKIAQTEGNFPTRGVRKNSLAGLPQKQKVLFERQRDLRQELQQQANKMHNKQKIRQQKELEMLHRNDEKCSEDLIKQEIQQNENLSAYEQEMEYKRQLELEREQRQKEKELKEQQAREVEYQRQMEEHRQSEIKMREKRERDLQMQTQREMEYRKQRDEQDEAERRQQEQRDFELRMQQEEIETEIRRQQEREKRMAEAREAHRLFEIRRKDERDRELERLEAELRDKREAELRQLEREIRQKREEKIRDDKEEEKRQNEDREAQKQAEHEQQRLEEEAAKEQREREKSVQNELKMRQKQEADRKQREEMELFDIEEERQRNEKVMMQYQSSKSNTYQSHTYQSQTVWPPSQSSTPAPSQQTRQIPTITTDGEPELNSSKFHFEPLDENQKKFMIAMRPPSTSYSPPTEDKPFPSIPYYQQHLVFHEMGTKNAEIFNPRAVSPTPNRSRSPAFGPPANPLRPYVNKTLDPEVDESGIYLCGDRLLSPVWYDKQQKPCPPGVQRKIHVHAVLPPAKPDIAALKEAVKKHKQESGTRPPPPPPPMPAQRRNSDEDNGEKKEAKSSEMPIPKGIVASQIRRLSGDATNSLSMFPIHSSITSDGNATESFPNNENDFKKTSRQNDYDDDRHETRQKTTNSFASSSISSAHQLTSNNNQFSSQSFDQQHFMGQSLASASFQNYEMNPNSVDNVRVGTGSIGAPGALPKHGRTFTTSGPNRGQGILTQPSTGRIPICGGCASQVRLVMGCK